MNDYIPLQEVQHYDSKTFSCGYTPLYLHDIMALYKFYYYAPAP